MAANSAFCNRFCSKVSTPALPMTPCFLLDDLA